jgi:hypothetical protein
MTVANLNKSTGRRTRRGITPSSITNVVWDSLTCG